MQSWPLTAFEEYMLCDDRPEYPMTMVKRVKLSGFFNRKALQAALDTVVSRHPLLRCTVKRPLGRRPIWVDHPDWRPEIKWNAFCSRYGYPRMSFLDLTTSPGIRFWVIEHQQSSDLIIQTHHACSDGIGIIIMLEELLMFYANAVTDTSPSANFRKLGPERFALRGSFRGTHRRVPRFSDHLKGIMNFWTIRPAPFFSKSQVLPESLSSKSFPALQSLVMSHEETNGYILSAKRMKVTVNELLLRDLFLTVGALRRENGDGNEKEWIRITVPVNLRSKKDSPPIVTNCVSMVFSEQRMANTLNPGELMKRIHDDEKIKSHSKLKTTFVESIDIIRRIPGLLSSFMTRNTMCFSTGVLSNLGVVFENTPLPRKQEKIVAGDVVIQGIDGSPPIRPCTQFAISVHTYNKRMSLMLNVDPRYFSDKQSQRFLDRMRSQIHTSILTGAGR